MGGKLDDEEFDLNEEYDQMCDPNNPYTLRFKDISEASIKLKSAILRTPCTKSPGLSRLTGSEIYLKKEFMQYTGSFKERGARYTLINLTKNEKERGVIAASAGNHALALAFHGDELGIPVSVVMPITAPLMKINKCKQYNANVIVKGHDISECKKFALQMAKQKDLSYINGYDHPDVLAGQGTVGLEISDQVNDIDAIVVPIGGGGLIAGVACAIKNMHPNVQVIGVEAERCASFKAALEAGEPTYTSVEPTLADGLAVPIVGVNAFETARKLVDKVVTVSEEEIAISILRLVELEKAVVEGAGASGLAAVLFKLPELKNKKVVIPLCGGNIDTPALGRCIDRGLAADGRLCRFMVQVSDRPGGVAEITRLVADLGVSLKDIFHERAWLKSDIFSVQVRFVVETRDSDHSKELEKILRCHYQHVAWGPHYL